MAATTLSFYANLLLVTIVVLLGQSAEAKPRTNLNEQGDYDFLMASGSDLMNSLETGAIGYGSDDNSRVSGSSLSRLYTVLARLGLAGRDRTLTDSRPDISPELTLISGLPLLSKRSGLTQPTGVLPPWQEFCRMLRMGNCWRYKRSLPDLSQRPVN